MRSKKLAKRKIERQINSKLFRLYLEIFPFALFLFMISLLLMYFMTLYGQTNVLSTMGLLIPLIISTFWYLQIEKDKKTTLTEGEESLTIHIIFSILLNVSQILIYSLLFSKALGHNQISIIGFFFIQMTLGAFSTSMLKTLNFTWISVFGVMMLGMILILSWRENPVGWPYLLIPLYCTILWFASGKIRDLLIKRLHRQIKKEEREKLLNMILEQSPLSIVITDVSARMVQVNREMEKITGYTKGELLGFNPSILKSGLTPKKTYTDLWDTLLRKKTWHGEFTNKSKNNRIYIEKASISPILDNENNIINYIAIKEDVTIQRNSQKTIMKQNQIIQLLLQDFEDNSESWLWEIDKELNLNYISDKLIKKNENIILGMPILEMLGKMLPPEDLDAENRLQTLERHLKNDIPFKDIELKLFIKGELDWIAVKGSPLDESIEGTGGWRGVGTNISEKKQLEGQLSHKENFDELTGLPNRNHFRTLLEDSISKDFNIHRGILGIISLEPLTEIRSKFGSLKYNGIISSIIETFQNTFQTKFILGKLDNRELAFWVDVNDVSQLEKVHSFAAAINRPIQVGTDKFLVHPKIGIAFYPDDANTQRQLFHAADLALNSAIKSSTRKVIRYQQNLTEEYSRQLTMIKDFNTALDTDQFTLFYQPQFISKTRKIKGAEALIRWQHPDLGFISPGQFIPLAEENGFISRLGEWIIYRACQDAADWNRELSVSINISSIQLQDPRRLNFVIRDALQQARLSPQQLILEITESFLLENLDDARQFLDDFQKMGIKIALDDFGTGYSSLAYLKKMKFNELKIDQSFIRPLHENDSEGMEIVETILEMARILKFKVVAEGVETEMQAGFLDSRNCDYLQGFLLSKPINQKDFKTLLEKETGKNMNRTHPFINKNNNPY